MARRVDPFFQNPVPKLTPMSPVEGGIPRPGHGDFGTVPVEQTLIPLPTPENGTVVPPRPTPPDQTSVVKRDGEVEFGK